MLFLFNFNGKGSIFWPAGHAKAYSRGKKEDNFSLKLNPIRARQIFVSIREKALAIMHMLVAARFSRISPKNLTRAEMDITRDDTI